MFLVLYFNFCFKRCCFFLLYKINFKTEKFLILFLNFSSIFYLFQFIPLMLVFVGFSSTDFLKFFVGDDRYFAVGCLGFLFFCVFIWRILKFIFNILYIKVLKDILNELGIKNRKILNSFKFCCLFFSALQDKFQNRKIFNFVPGFRFYFLSFSIYSFYAGICWFFFYRFFKVFCWR